MSRGFPFQIEGHVRPYDNTTLFCPAGMQQFKSQFRDPIYMGTCSNIQGCIRLNDLDEIGDGTHLLNFNMMGLFSFRELTVQDSVNFWFDFLTEINVLPDTVTIHPDKMEQWRSLYDGRDIIITEDPDCVWTDGELGGYCTEFYRDGVEIGNIVNTNGDCIDVGFGLERLLMFWGDESPDRLTVLKQGIEQIIQSGYSPGNKQQGYVLRRLLRTLVKEGGYLDHPFFEFETKRQQELSMKFNRLWHKNQDKSVEWWMGTHGIELDDFLIDIQTRSV